MREQSSQVAAVDVAGTESGSDRNGAATLTVLSSRRWVQ